MVALRYTLGKYAEVTGSNQPEAATPEVGSAAVAADRGQDFNGDCGTKKRPLRVWERQLQTSASCKSLRRPEQGTIGACHGTTSRSQSRPRFEIVLRIGAPIPNVESQLQRRDQVPRALFEEAMPRTSQQLLRMGHVTTRAFLR